MNEDFRSLTRDIRSALSDPVALAKKLNLDGKFKTNRATVKCPAHEDNHPSCSITQGKDGTVRAKCFSCDFTADAIGLVAKVLGLNTRGPDFILLLAECAKLAGMHDTMQALLKGRELPKRNVKPPTPKPEKPYPQIAEIKRVWRESIRPEDDVECSGYLVRRRIQPERAPARAILKTARLPRWAASFGEDDKFHSWLETGHRLIVPTFDANGLWKSLRAIRVSSSDPPKRLPPMGFRAQYLVMANKPAVLMLRRQAKPERVVVVEGEPDWLTWSSRTPPGQEAPYAVIGVVSGSWSEQLASRFPDGCNVIIRTHGDKAGDFYAAALGKSLESRCRLWRAA